MKKNKGFSKKRQELTEQKVRELFGQGLSDYEIEKKLNLQPHVLRHYRSRILEKDRIMFQQMKVEDVLSDYSMKMDALQKELEEALTLMDSKPIKAEVAAIGMKHRIENSVVTTAQSLGLLSKRGRELTVGKKKYRKKSMKEIRSAVDKEL